MFDFKTGSQKNGDAKKKAGTLTTLFEVDEQQKFNYLLYCNRRPKPFLTHFLYHRGHTCTGIRTSTMHVDGMLPHLLPMSLDDIGGTFTAKDIPPILVLPEHHDGLDAASRNVVYALHTLLHHTNNHFTAHGFVANGDNEPYVFFHDGMARPMARPAQRNGQGELSYHWKVFRAWYKRVGLE
jgi:hypothetical protein